MSDFCHVRRIRPHPGNIRDELGDLTELAASIRAHGIVQPLVVRPHPQLHGMFVILAGHRRFEAAKLAGLDEVPIVIRADTGRAKDIEIMLVENCQRGDLSAVEKAEAMGSLVRQGYTQARIAQATGLSQATVSYFLSLLELDEASRERVKAGSVQVGQAIAAVRKTRATTRQANGRRPRKVTVAEDHFTYKHPLAGRAQVMCELAGHTARKYGRRQSQNEGKIACGQCWEAVIRADERQVLAKTAVA